MSAPYRRYVPIERFEARLDPFDPGYDCVCPGTGCCNCGGKPSHCVCPPEAADEEDA